MTKEDFFKENFPEYVTEKGEFLTPYWDLFSAGVICATFELKVKIEQLEKENAELKERLLKVENAYKRKSESEWRLNDLYQKLLTDFANAEKCSREYFTRYRDMLDYFIKAKEHIENLLYYVKQCTCERSNYEEIEKDIKEAEQFLKEIEK